MTFPLPRPLAERRAESRRLKNARHARWRAGVKFDRQFEAAYGFPKDTLKGHDAPERVRSDFVPGCPGCAEMRRAAIEIMRTVHATHLAAETEDQ